MEMKLKKSNLTMYNYSQFIYNNFNYLYVYYFFISSSFIIFLDFKQLKNKEMYQLKNELYELNVVSKIILNKDKKKLFNSNFKFLGSHLFCIFIENFDSFIKICNILFMKKILFFYSFKNKFSNLLENTNQLDILGGKVFITIHFIIYKLILNIVILLLYSILILIKYINMK